MPALTKTDKSDNSDVISKSIAFFNRYGILILALVMLAVSVIHILPPFNADIINYDSSYQYFLTKHSLSDIMKLLPEDYSPPLYTLLLKLSDLHIRQFTSSNEVIFHINNMGIDIPCSIPCPCSFWQTCISHMYAALHAFLCQLFTRS